MKTCPICGAGAFDDAEVCYGCLHRFLEGDQGRETVSAGDRPGGARRPEALSRPEASRRLEGLARPDAPARADHAETVAATAPPPFDGAGWVVRFELPGFVPVACEGGGFDADGRPLVPDGGCALLRKDGVRAAEPSCGLIVRFQPESDRGAEERRRGRLARGSHARAAMIDARPLVPRPESV